MTDQQLNRLRNIADAFAMCRSQELQEDAAAIQAAIDELAEPEVVSTLWGDFAIVGGEGGDA